MEQLVKQALTMKRWILFTTYGWFIGIVFIVGLAVISETILSPEKDSGGQAVVGIGMSLGVGLMQWMALRSALSRKFFWFMVIGFSFAFILVDLVTYTFNRMNLGTGLSGDYIVPVTVVMGALLSSWLQYKFVLNPIMPRASRWVAYSVAGWFIADAVTIGTTLLNMRFAQEIPKALVLIFAVIFLSVGGPIYGYVSGLFMVPAVADYEARTTSPGVS